jgi:hypothetical protein
MQKFIMTRDINSYNGFGLPFSTDKWSTTLLDGVEQTVTVPKSPYSDCPNVLAVFSFAPGSSIWVANNETATVPGGSFASTSSELNPAARSVKGGDVLHFITNDASDELGVIFYATV